MFLTERIISLLTYTFALFIAYMLMQKVIRDQWKGVLLLYLITLCVFAFNYKPYVTADLYRLRQYITYWTNKSLSDVLSYALRHNAPTWVLYSYALSKLGDINWLQTVTCFWCFGNVFYIISHETVRNEVSGRGRSIPLFYVMAIGAFYLQTISGIRSMLGLSIVAFCFYRETVEKKRVTLHIPLYIFAALLHSSIMPLVMARFVFLIIENKDIGRRIIMTVLVLAMGAFSVYYIRDFINSAIGIGQNYLFGEQEYTYFWEILIGLIESVETIFVLRVFRRRYAATEEVEEYRSIRLFCIAWTILSLVSLPFSYAIFRRYTIFSSLLSIPLLIKTIEREQKSIDSHNWFINTVFGLSLIIFVISGVRGDLCGYKFFVR